MRMCTGVQTHRHLGGRAQKDRHVGGRRYTGVQAWGMTYKHRDADKVIDTDIQRQR